MANGDYDRIFRENIQYFYASFVEPILGTRVVKSMPLDTVLTGTFRKEVDHLVKVETGRGEELILHFEVQVKDDPSMLRRIKRYHGLLYFQYGLPIHHFVFYLGQNKAKMRTVLSEEEVFRKFHLISLRDQPLARFLNAEHPEEVLLGILANFGDLGDAEGIQQIIGAMVLRSGGSPELKRLLSQLTILSRIRKLDTVAHQVIEDMPLDIDIREVYTYQVGKKEGIDEGIEKGQLKMVLKMFRKGRLTVEEAAAELDMSLEAFAEVVAKSENNSNL